MAFLVKPVTLVASKLRRSGKAAAKVFMSHAPTRRPYLLDVGSSRINRSPKIAVNQEHMQRMIRERRTREATPVKIMTAMKLTAEPGRLSRSVVKVLKPRLEMIKDPNLWIN